jgi:hypothetical protein
MVDVAAVQSTILDGSAVIRRRDADMPDQRTPAVDPSSVHACHADVTDERSRALHPSHLHALAAPLAHQNPRVRHGRPAATKARRRVAVPLGSILRSREINHLVEYG